VKPAEVGRTLDAPAGTVEHEEVGLDATSSGRSAARALSLGVLIVATLACAAPVPGASAGFVSAIEDSPPFEPPTMTVTYSDPSDSLPEMDGEQNTVEISVAAGKLVVRDASAGVQGSDCEQNGPNEQLCPVPDRLEVRLGKLDDSLTVSDAGYGPAMAFGGQGDDVLTLDPVGSYIVGGPGADTMTGGPGRQLVSYDEKTAPVDVDLRRATGQGTSGEEDEIRGIEDVLGGKDDDLIVGDGGANELGGGYGEDRVSGGDGDDRLVNGVSDGADDLDGGAGTDTLDYSGRVAPVTVDLRTAAGQGAAGENDSAAGFEDARGGWAADVLIGDSGPNTLDGGIGGDLLQGGAGNDLLLPGYSPPNPSFGGPHLSDADGADESDGGPGTDTVDYGGRLNPVTIDLSSVSGQGQSGEGDRILAVEQALGGWGDDTLRGDAGVNLLDGRAGADTIESRDGVADSVLCGAGPDSAQVDTLDQATDCELVDRRDPPGPGGGSAQARDSTAPALLFAASNRRIRASPRGVVTFLLGPFDEDVDGALALRARKPLLAAKKRRPVRLGTARFTGTAGQTAKARVRLRARARKRLTRVHAIRAIARVSLRDAAGNVTARTYRVRLLAPRRPARRRWSQVPPRGFEGGARPRR
jgi:Ca2+-binding RTX toxin-like protein